MSKELIVSASSQETKAAILEGGEVVELHIERERDKGIVGGICKGRVAKVLPGMQSAFVNIGLERDAFLYVSDFLKIQTNTTRLSAQPKRKSPNSTQVSEPASEKTPAPQTRTLLCRAIRIVEFAPAARGGAA